MGASFKETNREAWDNYIAIMQDPTTPAGLGLTEIINKGYARVITQDIPHSNPNGEFPQGARGVRWARNNAEFMQYFNNYKERGLSKEDKRFSFGMLNDHYQNMIIGQAQMEKVVQCIVEMNALCIVPTFRIVKWAARMSFLPFIEDEHSFLKTTSQGSEGYTPENKPLGIMDVALTYSALEKSETKDKPSTQWESYHVDNALFMPNAAGCKPYTLNFSPYVLEKIEECKMARYNTYQDAGDGVRNKVTDAELRESLYKVLSADTREQEGFDKKGFKKPRRGGDAV